MDSKNIDALLTQFHSLVDINKTSLALSLFAIAFNPTAWNIVARNEYRNKTITRIFGGNSRYGCYFLTIMIFSFGILRDQLYHLALFDQPKQAMLPEQYAIIVPAVLFIVGQIFVITSTWALGITGTFLGDYFGILMDHRVEGFPFNVLRDPMYVGSTMCFAATALWYERPAGLFITVYVYIVYLIALRFEGCVSYCSATTLLSLIVFRYRPFTDMIYTRRAEKAKGKAL
ncbi:phospholipid methyltransferase-domain-containing protein [Crassisporium funariophilum]|nr:phospholipid methyltransferase-domain-containing protein [Crassisporium funariophilum]